MVPASSIYAFAPTPTVEEFVARLADRGPSPNRMGYPVYPFADAAVGVLVAENPEDGTTDIYAEGLDDATVDKVTRRIYDALMKNTDVELVLLEEDSFNVLARRESNRPLATA